VSDLKFKAHTEAAEHRLALLMESARSSGLRSVGASAAARIQQDTKRAFLETADPTTGSSWPARRREPADGHPLMRESGTLWADVLADFQLSGDAVLLHAYVDPSSPAADYGPAHQHGHDAWSGAGRSGGSISTHHLPARRFAGLTPEGREQIIEHARGPRGLLGKGR
jgi:phage gpG-like protein